MNQSPKYSVIIPVYNAEKTLRRCLDSLLCQKADAQIILVNDGSRDGSEAICREYACAHSRVHVLSRPNGGVSSARNAGLDMARGQYVLFVDSDDYVAPDYFARLDALGQGARYDLILFSSSRTDGHTQTPRILADETALHGDAAAQILSRAHWRKTINQPWNKRYRLELIRSLGLRFHESISIGEDKLFNLEYALACESCRVSSAMLYYVSIADQNSLSRKPRSDLQEQFALLDEGIRRLLQRPDIPQRRRDLFQAAENLMLHRSVYASAKRMHRTGTDRRTRIRQIRSMCAELNARRLRVPPGKFSMMICLPIRLRMAWFIDLSAKKLAS